MGKTARRGPAGLPGEAPAEPGTCRLGRSLSLPPGGGGGLHELLRRAIMSTVVTPQSVSDVAPAAGPREVRIYSHSCLYYWWPVWVVGYLLALLTYIQGQPVTFQGASMLGERSEVTVLIHPSR